MQLKKKDGTYNRKYAQTFQKPISLFISFRDLYRVSTGKIVYSKVILKER